MRFQRTSLMLLVAAGLAGCDSGSSVDTAKLVTPTAEQNAAINAYDKSVNDEEFRKPEPSSKPARTPARKRAASSN